MELAWLWSVAATVRSGECGKVDPRTLRGRETISGTLWSGPNGPTPHVPREKTEATPTRRDIDEETKN